MASPVTNTLFCVFQPTSVRYRYWSKKEYWKMTTLCGGIGRDMPATEDVQAVCEAVKADIAGKVSGNLTEFKAISHKTQVCKIPWWYVSLRQQRLLLVCRLLRAQTTLSRFMLGMASTCTPGYTKTSNLRCLFTASKRTRPRLTQLSTFELPWWHITHAFDD